MENYREFLNRINEFEKKELIFEQHFQCSPSLISKVDGNNNFKSFYGDTVVFDIPEAVKDRLAEYVDLLYTTSPKCFCERLIPQTFHITLHDLSNAQNFSAVSEEIILNEQKITEKKSEISSLIGDGILFKSKFIFNMMNTSLVLGLYPIDEFNYEKLMKLYTVIDEVKTLPYPLTPHITLAYYSANGFDNRASTSLACTVNEMNSKLNLSIHVQDLYYQKFNSMNNYINIVKLS